MGLWRCTVNPDLHDLQIAMTLRSLWQRSYLHCYALNSVFDWKRWNVCLFVGSKGRIGFVCFWTVVSELAPPLTGIHYCLFGHKLRPLTSPNGWLIQVKATVGPLFPFLQMITPSGLQGKHLRFSLINNCLQVLMNILYIKKLYKLLVS